MITALCISSAATSQGVGFRWAKSVGGTGNDMGQSLATDALGNVYVTGFFQGPILIFGPDTLRNAGNYDMFVAKIDSAGTPVWAKSAGGASNEGGLGIAVDVYGNSFVAGYFQSASITFGSTILTNSGMTDMFLVKFDANGNALWGKSAGGHYLDVAQGVAVDAAGNCFVTGSFGSPQISFGTDTLTNAGGYDFYTVKYDPKGNELWARSAGSGDFDEGYDVAVDGLGNCFVAGSFKSAMIVLGADTLRGSGYFAPFVIKYSTNGDLRWARSSTGGGLYQDYAYGVSADRSGDCYITGSYSSPVITFDPYVLENRGVDDIFVVKYDSTGRVSWAKGFGSAGDEYALGIATDAGGNSVLTGAFGPSPLPIGSDSLMSDGEVDTFVMELDLQGNPLWALKAGGEGNDAGNGVSVDILGNTCVTGQFSSQAMLFGSDSLKNQNSGSYDIFLAKIGTLPTEVFENDKLLHSFPSLFQNYPNPFNPLTTINFSLGKSSAATLKVYNVLGEIVATLVDGRLRPGNHTVHWDASRVPSGVYFCKLSAGTYSDIRKMVVMK